MAEPENASGVKLKWDERGVPHSVAFDDQYFCKDNGYDEAVHVCCRGNRLSERFAALPSGESGVFTIVETGFGTGLDFCCAWELWNRTAPRSWKLRFVSVEMYPVSVGDMDRALGLWPQIAPCREALVKVYESKPRDILKAFFNAGCVALTVIFDDAAAGLRRMTQENIVPARGADAFFFDGFAPSKNPAMWSEEVFAAASALSHEGTTFSTFTVAGAVRRGLEAQGFRTEKIPGHGKKKQILTGFLQSTGTDKGDV